MTHESGHLTADGVRGMFDRIAPVYDLMNRVMTVGLDQRWRRLAVRLVVRPGDRVLDGCCGTGDLAIAAQRAGAEVVGLDFSAAMLERARRKAPRARMDPGRSARAAVRERVIRRGNRWLRRPQRRRPRARARRASARPPARRPPGNSRDHDAARAVEAVLQALVRRPDPARRARSSPAARPTPTSRRAFAASRDRRRWRR